MPRLLLPLALAAVIGGCDAGDLNLDDVKAHGDFLLSDNVMGTVLKATARKDVGEKVTFVGLNTKDPRVVFGGSGGNYPFKKVYETEDVVTLMWVATGTGSVDAFVIDRKTGKFARAAAGKFSGVYASASVGLCR